jgi:hypothetical protein
VSLVVTDNLHSEACEEWPEAAIKAGNTINRRATIEKSFAIGNNIRINNDYDTSAQVMHTRLLNYI